MGDGTKFKHLGESIEYQGAISKVAKMPQGPIPFAQSARGSNGTQARDPPCIATRLSSLESGPILRRKTPTKKTTHLEALGIP